MQNDQPVNRIISLEPTPLTALTTEDLRTVVWAVADSAGPTTDDASVQMTLDNLGLGHARNRPDEPVKRWAVRACFGGKGKLYAYEVEASRQPELGSWIEPEGGSEPAQVVAYGAGNYNGPLKTATLAPVG